MEAQTPILVIEGLDVLAFSSIEAAQRHLEPWWVQEERGFVYDASGRRMKAVCRGQSVILSVDREDRTREGELSAALRAHFRATGKPRLADQSSSLSQMVAALTAK
jgi:hypothetical protein